MKYKCTIFNPSSHNILRKWMYINNPKKSCLESSHNVQWMYVIKGKNFIVLRYSHDKTSKYIHDARLKDIINVDAMGGFLSEKGGESLYRVLDKWKSDNK